MTRRSSTSYFISLRGSSISWRTIKQSVVVQSSAEAKYRAMTTTVCETVWLVGFFLTFKRLNMG